MQCGRFVGPVMVPVSTPPEPQTIALKVGIEMCAGADDLVRPGVVTKGGERRFYSDEDGHESRF